MRRLLIALLLGIFTAGAGIFVPGVRSRVRAIVRPEPPPQITPLAVSVPKAPATARAAPRSTTRPTPSLTAVPPAVVAEAQNTASTPVAALAAAAPAAPAAAVAPAAAAVPTATAPPTATTVPPAPTPTAVPPAPTPPPAPVVVNGRVYDAYIPAATKPKQAYRYSCEFDAAWVILQTYGFNVSVDDLIAIVGVDRSVEPTIEQTKQGIIIRGGDILNMFSGDINKNFMARSTGPAISKAFRRYGLRATAVRDRAGIEAALRAGQLVWIKTTVDFKPWRPATWVMPDGRTRRVVLGNDHAVVVMGFSARGVVIRDVLGPTSSNWKRPYEYEVAWDNFLAAWGAQESDGVAVAPPQ